MVGEWDERKARTEVPRIKAELQIIAVQINDLIGLPMLNAIVQGSKLENWREWPVADKRSFLRLVVDHVQVYPYPDGIARTRPRFKGESERDYLDATWEILKIATASRIKVWSVWGQEI